MNEQVDTKLEEKLETVADFLSYEEYLDSQIQPLDEYFLEDKELARELVQLGYRGGSQADTISREEFTKLKRIQNDKKSFQKEAPKLLVRYLSFVLALLQAPFRSNLTWSMLTVCYKISRRVLARKLLILFWSPWRTEKSWYAVAS